MTHLLIIETRLNEDIADILLREAVIELESNKATVDIVTVPTIMELPSALSMAFESNVYDGYVILGHVIRDEFSLSDYIMEEAIRGINNLAIEFGLALGLSIIDISNIEQAINKLNIGNKGQYAARTAVEMINLKNYFNNLEVKEGEEVGSEYS